MTDTTEFMAQLAVIREQFAKQLEITLDQLAEPECSADDALHLLDDIRQRFSEIRFMHEGQSFGITLSAGVATSEQCTDAQSLLMAADAALYVAKNSGRNQVRRFGDVDEQR